MITCVLIKILLGWVRQATAQRASTVTLISRSHSFCGWRPMLTALVLFVTTQKYVAGADPLYHREVKQENPEGKDFIMTFLELRRDEKTSTAKVTFVSGRSVPSAMFIIRGFYDIARARGAKYFIKLKEWKTEEGAWMYLVGFSQEKHLNTKRYFGLSEPLPNSDDHGFVLVKQFDAIFEKR